MQHTYPPVVWCNGQPLMVQQSGLTAAGYMQPPSMPAANQLVLQQGNQAVPLQLPHVAISSWPAQLYSQPPVVEYGQPPIQLQQQQYSSQPMMQYGQPSAVQYSQQLIHQQPPPPRQQQQQYSQPPAAQYCQQSVQQQPPPPQQQYSAPTPPPAQYSQQSIQQHQQHSGQLLLHGQPPAVQHSVWQWQQQQGRGQPMVHYHHPAVMLPQQQQQQQWNYPPGMQLSQQQPPGCQLYHTPPLQYTSSRQQYSTPTPPPVQPVSTVPASQPQVQRSSDLSGGQRCSLLLRPPQRPPHFAEASKPQPTTQRQLPRGRKQPVQQDQGDRNSAIAAAAAAASEAPARRPHHNQCNCRLLQLPDAAIAGIAARLPPWQRVQLGLRVLPRGSAAAAAMLGTIQRMEHVKYALYDAPPFLSELRDLQHVKMKIGCSTWKHPMPQLASLASLSGLTSLEVTVSDKGAGNTPASPQMQRQGKLLAAIGSLVHLQKLSFTSVHRWAAAAGSQAFAGLSGLSGLQSLHLQFKQCPAGVGLEEMLSGLTGLTQLSLIETTDRDVRRKFYPDSPELNTSAVQAVGRAWPRLQLQRLLLRSQLLAPAAVRCLQLQPQRLRVLEVSGCVGLWTDGFSQQLVRLTALQELHASSCWDLRTQHLAAAVTGLSSLTLLDISCNGMSALKGCITTLQQLTSLQHLAVDSSRVANSLGEACSVIAAQLTRLTHLSIGAWKLVQSRRVPAQQLLQLSGLSGLSELHMYGVNLATDGDRAVLKPVLSGLTSLGMHGCGVEKCTGKAAVRREFPGLRAVDVQEDGCFDGDAAFSTDDYEEHERQMQAEQDEEDAIYGGGSDDEGLGSDGSGSEVDDWYGRGHRYDLYWDLGY